MYKERLLQSSEVKEYFQQVIVNLRKQMKPDMKAAIDEFELKVSLDENAQLELRQNNHYLNAKEQLQKFKKQKKQQASANKPPR